LRYIIFLLISLSIWACNHETLYEETKTIPQPWTFTDKIQFDYVVSDTTKAYDLYVHVTHADSFAYENVYVMVTTIFPGGDSTRNQLSLQLAASNGQWQGACGGNTCELSIPMSSAAYFRQSGNYSLIFEQHSRDGALYGIERLGLTIKETRK
jgi:gliding motility-associated lipoprotein GldH